MSDAALYTADWVVPVTRPPIENGGVLVVDGRIAAVAPANEIDAGPDVERVHLQSAILMPGMINVHAHPELSFLRGALEDLPFHKWIPRLRRIKLATAFTPEELRDAALWSCAEAAAAGITALGATEDSDASIHALSAAGMRGIAFREVFAPDPSMASAALQGLRDAVDLMRSVETDIVRVGVSPHAPYTVSDDLFRAVAAFARDNHLRVAVHTAESETEQLLVTRGEGVFAEGLRGRGIDTPVRAASTVELLKSTGILDLAPLLIHCVRVTSADISAIASAGASVAHCPIANARLGHGVAPVPEMLDAGVVVGLGTDSVASNNRIDLLEEARVSQIVQRARMVSTGAMDAETLLRLVTIDAARALGIEQRVGALDVGMDADMCAISVAAPRARPVFDPVSTLFMSCSGADTILTMVRGRIIYRNGVHPKIDVAALRQRIDDMGRRVRAAAQEA